MKTIELLPSRDPDHHSHRRWRKISGRSADALFTEKDTSFQRVQKQARPERQRRAGTNHSQRVRSQQQVSVVERTVLLRRRRQLPHSQASKCSIIVSRHPIDIMRMSDFMGWHLLCHREGGEYRMRSEVAAQGGVAYVVKTKDPKTLATCKTMRFCGP